MKYLVFTIFLAGISLGQAAVDTNYPGIINIEYSGKKIFNYMITDMNRNGKNEILQGEKIIRLNEHEYWVKNTELTTESGDKFSFYSILKKNGHNIINQVNAVNGYILVFSSGSAVLEVFIAGKNGEKDSDPVFVSLD